MKIKLPIMFALVLLEGCASAPIGNAVIDNSNLLRGSEGVIAVCRPSAAAALAWSPDIVMNNVPVAKISSGSIVEIVQPSGNTSIRFKHITFTDPGYNGSMDNFGIDTVVAPGEKQYVIMGPNLDSLIVLPNIASAVSISWGVFEESAAAFNRMCGNYKKIRVRYLDETIEQLASNDEPKITLDSNSLTLPQRSIIEDLQSLVDMYEEGLLTEEQFTTAKELRLSQ